MGLWTLGSQLAVYAINMKGDVMSRKDYELIVAALARAWKDCPMGHDYGAERAVECLAQAFQTDNPRFDYDRFVDAFWAKARERS